MIYFPELILIEINILKSYCSNEHFVLCFDSLLGKLSCEDHMSVSIEAMSSFGLKYSLDYIDKFILSEIITG